MADRDFLKQLVDHPTESLSVELKSWLDIETPQGQAKLIKFALAARNLGGGFLLIGFDDKTARPIADGRPANVQVAYHIDKVQSLVARFASEPFEVKIHFIERGGQEFPVIEVPGGVRTPVASKSALSLDGNNKLIREGAVYMRSLASNSTPSSTEAKWSDWRQIAEVCFDNREADVGRFVRRHLTGISKETIGHLAAVLGAASNVAESTDAMLKDALNMGLYQYAEVLGERKLVLPVHGSSEVAVLLPAALSGQALDQGFLSRLMAANPKFTGWPAWLDSRIAQDRTLHPYVTQNAWEAAMFLIGTSADHVDFWRLSPSTFYLYRAFQDDISSASPKPVPGKSMDFGLPIYRTAEAIAVALRFAQEMAQERVRHAEVQVGVDEEMNLLFAFRWKGLKGRQITNWAQPNRILIPGNWLAYDNEVVTTANVPIDTPLSALSQFVIAVTKPLFNVFNGFYVAESVVEDMVQRLIERRIG